MRGEQLAQFAVSAAFAANERDEPPVLAFPEEIHEKLGSLLAHPVFRAAVFGYVDRVEIHGLAEVERRKAFLRYFPAQGFICNPKSATVEIPCEIFRLVDIEAQNVVFVELFGDDVGCRVATARRNEDHGQASLKATGLAYARQPRVP